MGERSREGGLKAPATFKNRKLQSLNVQLKDQI